VNDSGPIRINTNAFADWPAFEAQLRHALAAQIDPPAVERVMARTQDAFNVMQLRNLARSVNDDLAADLAHNVEWRQDFRAAKMKVLMLLVENFVSLERSRR
jgi:hypothetical protein